MAQTWVDIDPASGGDSPATAWPKANDKFTSLQSNFSGTALPSPYVAGKAFFDITAAASPVMKHYVNGSWTTVLLHHYNQSGALDMNDYETLNFRFENRSTTDASEPTTAGRCWYNEVTGFLEYDDNTVSGSVKKIHAGDLDYYEPLDLTLGATAPSATTFGSSPAVTGYQLDSIAKTVRLTGMIPQHWEGNSDMYLTMFVALPNAESTNDPIQLTANYIVCTPGSGNKADKTSTQKQDSYDITTITGQYAIHEVPITIDYDDATNPCCHGDVFFAEVGLTTTQDLDNGIIVLRSYLNMTRNR